MYACIVWQVTLRSSSQSVISRNLSTIVPDDVDVGLPIVDYPVIALNMPQTITQTTVTASEEKPSPLRTYYCLCGDFLLVLQGDLSRLPARQTDGAIIIQTQGPKARKFILNAEDGDRRILEFDDGVEVRQESVCSRCRLVVAYQTSLPPAGSGEYLYVLRGGMTET